MKIEKIEVNGAGYVHCKSAFYTSHDVLWSDRNYSFSTGINILKGEIDSGIWAISYLLSMYDLKPKHFILSESPTIIVNNTRMELSTFLKNSCYMEKSYPLFSTGSSVRNIISNGLKKNKSEYTPNEIKDLFRIDSFRFERPITGVGNEIFRVMASIGYVYGKNVLCFPWLSQSRFNAYHGHMTDLLDILKTLDTIVILPIGK